MDKPSSPSKPSKTELDYRAEDDFRTLQRAEEVRGDGARHGRALGHGRKQLSAITQVMRKSARGKGARLTARPATRVSRR